MNRLKDRIHPKLLNILQSENITELRPAQRKAIDAGLIEGTSILVCTPTASGKTLIAEIALINQFLYTKRKGIYIVPLKALASEKHKDFTRKYGKHCRVALSIGDYDDEDSKLSDADIIITTSEKLDSLLRHHTSWLREVQTLVIDEIHLLNDVSRGPTLEILITLIRSLLPTLQLIGLSATIGNADELSAWLRTKLILDDWRPIKLYKGVLYNNTIEFKQE